eukprot:m.12778 g.12778  ORF g.12778 m.12778 type:complete len:375 (-) comp4354_c0_seq1:80-1204(-)
MADAADAAKFCELTGATPDRAAFFLAAAGGDLEVAVTQFFESGAEAAAPMADVSTATAAAATPAAAASAPSGPRIATLSSMQTGPDGDDEQDGSNELYAGGKTSGIAVQGPPKKLDGESVKAVFDAAKEHGAVAAHERESKPAAAAPRFTGAGYRLGEEGEPSAVVAPSAAAAAAAAPAKPEDMEVTVTFYRNGFTVDDGVNPVTLRNLDEPQNAAFLNSITRNQMPEELVSFGKPIDLHMVDKRDAEYVPPKPTVKSFSGTGHRLGAPTTAGATADATAAPAAPPVSSGPAPTVNEDEPVTKLQLKLADGTRMVARFNLTQTVSDIRRVMDSSRPASAPYVLMTTFPNRVLTDETETIEVAKLAGAVVIQRPA